MFGLEPVTYGLQFQHVPFCATTAFASSAIERYIYVLSIYMLGVQIISVFICTACRTNRHFVT